MSKKNLIQLYPSKHNIIVVILSILFTTILINCNSSNQKTSSKANQKMTHKMVRKGYVDSRFGQIHYRSFGTTDTTNNPLLLLHLSPNSSQVFTQFLPLIGKDRFAVAPDYPGYGMSDAIPGEQRIADYASAMFDVIETLKLKEPIDILGYHTGAAVALEMAKQRPDQIKNLSLVAVPVLTQKEREAGAALPKVPFDTLGEFAKKEWQSSWKWKGPGQSKESVYKTFSEKMRPSARELGASAILAYDVAPTLKEIRHPLLIVQVGDDLWEATARAIALRPDVISVSLPEYGHGLFHVAPEKMDMIVRKFLNEKQTTK